MVQVRTQSIPTPTHRTALAPATRHPQLSRRQKAAIIVRILLREGADISLADLPEAMQMDLTHEMGALRLIDKRTLHSVVTEFVHELNDLGIAFAGGLQGAIDTLEGSISPTAAQNLRRETGVPVKGDPWKIIASLGSDAILEILRRESTEISAVVLSKLPVARSAELLGKLPGEMARRITYAMSTTGKIDPGTVHTIGLSVAEQLTSRTPLAFDEPPVKRISEILNNSKAATREDVLTGLESTDADFAGAVRKAIFTFENVHERIAPRDVPKIARAVNQNMLVTALKSAETQTLPAAEFILSSMSQRLAGQLREEMEELGQIKDEDGEEAMSAVVAVIREMEQAGELTFQTS